MDGKCRLKQRARNHGDILFLLLRWFRLSGTPYLLTMYSLESLCASTNLTFLSSNSFRHSSISLNATLTNGQGLLQPSQFSNQERNFYRGPWCGSNVQAGTSRSKAFLFQIWKHRPQASLANLISFISRSWFRKLNQHKPTNHVLGIGCGGRPPLAGFLLSCSLTTPFNSLRYTKVSETTQFSYTGRRAVLLLQDGFALGLLQWGTL